MKYSAHRVRSKTRAAIKRREATRAGTSQVATKIGALRDEANATLLATEGQLKLLAGKRDLGTAWVHAFVPGATGRTPQTNTPAPAPAPPPAG